MTQDDASHDPAPILTRCPAHDASPCEPGTLSKLIVGPAQSPVHQLAQITGSYSDNSTNVDALRVQLGSIDPGYELGGASPSQAAIVGSLEIPNGAYRGSTLWPSAAVAAYGLNNSTKQSLTAFYSLCGTGVPGSFCEGLNASVVNCPLFKPSCVPGKAFDFTYMYVSEIDVNVYSKAGHAAPAGNVVGYFADLHADVQNTGSLTAFLAGTAIGGPTPVPWKVAFASNSGVAQVGLSLGAVAAKGPSRSQAVNLVALNPGSKPLLSSIFEGGDGDLYVVNAGSGASMRLGGSGLTLANGRLGATLYTPPSSSSPCNPGQFADDANYHYVCVATNTWKRVALTTW